MSLSQWIERVSGGILGMLLPLALIGVGVIYLVALRAFPVRHPVKTLRCLLTDHRRDALHALSIALAGTLGVGNIAGVALAVAVGGAGSVFWMWVSAALAMLLKYAEILLAIRYREGNTGGAMYYMKKGIGGRLGGIFAVTFSALCLLCAFSLGSMAQANAAAESALTVFGLPAWLSGLILLPLSLWVTVGGAKGIGRVTARLIPFLTLFYFGLSLFAICRNASALPDVMRRILSDAFSPLAATGGLGGFLTARGIRYGVTRGLVSNEAGAGTAPMAHATAKSEPVYQGVLGMVEVFIDTFVLCTATALVVLIAYSEGLPLSGGMSLALSAFGRLVGSWTAIPIALSVLLFVYATVICWCYYGECAVSYLFGGRRGARGVYLFLFHGFLWVGAVFTDEAVWLLSDLSISLMTVLNLIALLYLMPVVRKETKKAFK